MTIVKVQQMFMHTTMNVNYHCSVVGTVSNVEMSHTYIETFKKTESKNSL